MSYMDHIKACNTWDFSGYRGFWVDDARIGWVRHGFAEALAPYGDAVSVAADGVRLLGAGPGFAERSRAVAGLLDRLVADGVVPPLRGELYPALPAWGAAPLFAIDRAVVNHFGVTAYGLHVNGFVRRADGGVDLWIGRRALDRGVAPGKLDNLIAGGQPIGLSLRENLIKEAHEEAGIAPELAVQARPVGVITYIMDTPVGLKVDGLFLYDLELPPGHMPRNTDGEVDGFELMPWERVAEIVRETDDFKFNCNLVIIDFLIRHGLITPDHPDYLALAAGLRRWG